MPPLRERNPFVICRIIGDVLDPFTRTVNLTVHFNNKKVINSCDLTPSQVANHPRVQIGGDDVHTFYTLIMVDLDAPNPSSPTHREYLHWLVINIPAFTGADFGHEVLCYESPRPWLGIHRLLLVLYQQLGWQTVYSPGWRQNFNIKDFAEIYDLGSPVAAVFFNCKREKGT